MDNEKAFRNYRPDITLDVYRGRKTTMQQHSETVFWNAFC